MSNSKRGQISSSSRRSETVDHEEFLDLLASLSTSRGSVRSHSGRHTWRPGVIPTCLQPPHRIQSHFPVPKNTLARVPELNHPDLSRGQKSYMHSIAQIYSLDDTKRSLSNSYYGLLMSELLKGGGRDDSHKRYAGWIYGNHKRLFETNPKIWRSRKLRSSREDSTDRPPARDGRSGSSSRKSDRAAESTVERPPAQPTNSSSSPRRAAQPADAEPTPSRESKEPETEQPRRRLQSARSRGNRGGSGRPTRTQDVDPESTVRVSEVGTNNGSRGRSAGRGLRTASAASKNSRKNKDGYADSDDEGDGRRPRDLSSIMY